MSGFGTGSRLGDAGELTTLEEAWVQAQAPDGSSASYLRNDISDVTPFNLRMARTEIDDANTYLDRDSSGNLTFTDIVSGTSTLADLLDPEADMHYWNGVSWRMWERNVKIIDSAGDELSILGDSDTVGVSGIGGTVGSTKGLLMFGRDDQDVARPIKLNSTTGELVIFDLNLLENVVNELKVISLKLNCLAQGNEDIALGDLDSVN